MLKAIIWKEARSFIHAKLQFIGQLSFSVFWGFYIVARFHQVLLISTALVTMYASVYVFCWLSYREEMDKKTLPSLLASPLTVRGLITAKGLTVFGFSYVNELIGITVSTGFAWFQIGKLPSLAAAFTALIVVPIWGFAIIELLGIAYSLVRGSTVMWFLALPIFLILISPVAPTIIRTGFSSLWLPPVAGLGVVALLYELTGKLSKDRMTRLAS